MTVFALQIVAPKCAICWTTYAGLFGASWFAATRYNPVWFAATLCVMFVVLSLTWREARRTRQYAAAFAILAGWLLMLFGAFVGVAGVRWVGVLWLGIVTAMSLWPVPGDERGHSMSL
ncbi:hypothetical protein [Paraburkholderia sp. J67]|uniref:hypothetical protein n=1 Tax=Paraburkholderia sp. J67 TaxID=2805435 RepID=UPI002ABDB912|nr:hypothetical protein [Paraburkholderia sp. J67]